MKITFIQKSATLLFSGLFLTFSVPAQENPFADLTKSVSPAEQQWVDSIFNALSPDERLGQLFMAAAYSNRGPEHTDALLRLVR